VFITSAFYDGNLGGLAGADAKCQSAALAAGLPGTFKAWLSSQTVSARDRLTHNPGPYVLVDTSVVALNWSQLTSGLLLHPINKTETNAIPSAGLTCASSLGAVAYTNTNGDGTLVGSGQPAGPYRMSACLDWTTSSGNEMPVVGDSGAVNGIQGNAQTNWTWECQFTCNISAHLYCFEQ
jgi:hypothetical protein